MTTPAAAPSARLASLDVLRGAVCVLMAIDHVRVYSGLPAGGPFAGIFLTRWVTHFVAPAFCFLAGAGVYFLAKRLSTSELRRFLVSRGLLLVLLELTLIRFLWAFSVGTGFMLAGVIWMLGWCMVLLAAFVAMPAKRVGWAGVAVIVLQPLLFLLARVMPSAVMDVVGSTWAFIYPSGRDALFGINVLYVIVPWIGVMMAGFGFGPILERPEAGRHRCVMRIGLGLTVGFLALGAAVAVVHGGGSGEDGPPMAYWMRVLNQNKYPASLPFLMMTLGPLIALIPWAERAKGWGVRALETFGRVPMWYYLMHLTVIHTAAVIVTRVRTGEFHFDWFSTAPYTQVPDEGRWSLLMLYAVWAACIVALYPLCAWYAARKRDRPAAWMRYI